jgi:16S rRNA (cytosine967-C5)-methyltransferase
VVQRRVDVRWRLSPSEITRLSNLQLEILTNAAKAVKSGGRIVYSTCSIDEEEDSSVVKRFIAEHPDFTFVKDKLALPFVEKSDGAYAALLIRA